MAACSHHCSLRHPATSLGHWYTGIYLRIFDPGPSNPITFLGLCSPGDYRQSIDSPIGVPTFNSTEKALTFTIYDFFLRIWPKKVCYLTKAKTLSCAWVPVMSVRLCSSISLSVHLSVRLRPSVWPAYGLTATCQFNYNWQMSTD